MKWIKEVQDLFPKNCVNRQYGNYVAEVIFQGWVILLREKEPTEEERFFWMEFHKDYPWKVTWFRNKEEFNKGSFFVL